MIPGIPDTGSTYSADVSEAVRSCPAEDARQDAKTEASVVICAYTEQRWDKLCAAIESVFGQRPRASQLLLVVDHNAALAKRARQMFPGLTVLENDGEPGLSSARNVGLRAATQSITVFLDDDAEARPGWLTSLIEPYSRSNVVATGGSVYPRWPGIRPQWAPPAFDWVFGCSYLGLPDSVGPVRNPIGANMSMRTRLALEVGGFNASVGRVGAKPRGCEETELAIRLTAGRPGSAVFYVPNAVVDHHVGTERVRWRYFLQRCWHEGLSKATVVQLTSSSAGLERERRHIAVVIPLALYRDLRKCLTGDRSAFMRMTATIAGMTAVIGGYGAGRIGLFGRRQI